MPKIKQPRIVANALPSGGYQLSIDGQKIDNVADVSSRIENNGAGFCNTVTIVIHTDDYHVTDGNPVHIE